MPDTRRSSKWIKDINVENETIDVLEENVGEFLYNLRGGGYFITMTPK